MSGDGLPLAGRFFVVDISVLLFFYKKKSQAFFILRLLVDAAVGSSLSKLLQ